MQPLALARRAACALAATLALALSAPVAGADIAYNAFHAQDWNSSPPKLQGELAGWVSWLKFGSYERSGGQPFAPPVPPGIGDELIELSIHILAGLHTDAAGCQTIWREVLIYAKFNDDSVFTWTQLWQLKVCPDGSSYESSRVVAIAEHVDPVSGLVTGATRTYARDNDVVAKRAAWRGEAGASLKLADLGSLPRPLVGGGFDAVDVTLGPGGVLDLRGLDGAAGPLFDTGSPVTVRCDTILLDPGVQLADLFQPAPLVLPGAEVRELALVGPPDAYFTAPGPATVSASVINLGNVPLAVTVDGSDSLGWSQPGPHTVGVEPLRVVEVDRFFVVPPVPPGTASQLLVQASAPLAQPVSNSALVMTVAAATPPATYCTAKPNSLGCVPQIGASGALTLSGYDDLLITASDVLSGMGGVFFYGLAPLALPFQGGTLCVAPPVLRSPLNLSGGSPPATACDGLHVHHFTQADLAAAGLAAGTTVYGQWWTRDANDPLGSGLTDALQLTVGP